MLAFNVFVRVQCSGSNHFALVPFLFGPDGREGGREKNVRTNGVSVLCMPWVALSICAALSLVPYSDWCVYPWAVLSHTYMYTV